MSNQLLIAILPLVVGGTILLLWSAVGSGGYRWLREALPTGRGGMALARVTPAETDALVGTDMVLAVRLSGRRGRPLTDSVVSWRVMTGDAVLAEDSVRTNDRGEALNTLRLPEIPGHLSVMAMVREAHPPQLVFNIDVDSAGASRLHRVRGNGQAGLSGFPLPDPLSVEVTDRNGDAVPSVAVRFQIRSGGGIVDPQVVLTDAFGRASAQWRLGPALGRQETTVRIPAAGDTTFTFVARAEEAPEPAGDSSPTTVAEETATVADASAQDSVIATPEPMDTPVDPVEQEAADPTGANSDEADREVVEPGAVAELPVDSALPDSAVGEGATPEPLAIVRRSHAVGGGHVCLLSGGTVRCRGANDRGQSGGTGAGPLISLVAGLSHTCGLDAAGAAVCWGGNESGQLGDGSRSDGSRARPVLGDVRFAMLAAGVYHTCGLDRSERIHCWGGNPDGQLGDGTRDDHPEPRPVEGGAVFRRVVAGWNHTCGLEVTGGVLCWGSNDDGQLGDGSRVDRLTPVRTSGRFSALAGGSAHTCGISGGRVLCWGDNAFGQLGDGTTNDRTRPVTVPNLGNVVEIAAGALHTCALVEGGVVYCWGQNLRGELGDGTNQDRSRPTRVAGGLTFRSVEAGGAVTCAFSTDGSEYCWGQNRSGQLGDGSRTGRAVPTPVVSR